MQYPLDFEKLGNLKHARVKETLNRCTTEHKSVFKRILAEIIPSKNIHSLKVGLIKSEFNLYLHAGNPRQLSQGGLVVFRPQFGNCSSKQLGCHITQWIKLGMSQESTRSHRYQIGTSVYKIIPMPLFLGILSIHGSLYNLVQFF